ncbi:hypothetical protein [Kribbella sp. C-35]|uniref:hypothetical protein n=1 Tax=Kribbella sp. C-35 TaxID=2789276 RepID=UPI003979F9B5
MSDQLKPRDTATHRYKQNWHANPVQAATSKAAVTKFTSGANLTVVRIRRHSPHRSGTGTTRRRSTT